jgi:thiol-disulfide isomerase/thioredoxin
MIKKFGFLGLCLSFSLFAAAQVPLNQGKWYARLLRNDGHQIPFDLDIQQQNGKSIFYIVNGTERIKMENIEKVKDSLIIRMPVFESYFRVKQIGKDSLNGVWVSGGAKSDIVIPLVASAGARQIPLAQAANANNIEGKWKFEFTRANETKRFAIGEFQQNGKIVSGSVLTPSGDYRYLNGTAANDSLFLSTFDGSHAIVLSAKIGKENMQGYFYSGATTNESWTAVKDDDVKLEAAETGVKEGGDGKLAFTFKDLDGKPVSIQSDKYKGKVVILQLMGSWCPNCMDETAFLSEYYRKNKDRGVEIIALGYELSTDETRSINSLKKFQKQFKVEYPMLYTGATASDPMRTEKTLPQLTALKVFPTTIILDKTGVVSDIATGFYGPGSGEYHVKYKAHFEQTINTLLGQQ